MQGSLDASGDAAAAPKRTYRPPNTHRTARSAAPPHTPDRFYREVLGGRLWHPACQDAAAAELSDQIPLQFGSVEEYISTFDPLVLEEAREGLKADWAESCAGGRVWAVTVSRVEEAADGWVHVWVRAHSNHGGLKQACQGNTAVVLTLGRPPQRAAPEWAQSEVEGSQVAGKRGAKRARTEQAAQSREASAEPGGRAGAERSAAEGDGFGGAEAGEVGADAIPPQGRVVAGLAVNGREEELMVKLHPGCTHHGGAAADAPCCAVVNALRWRPQQRWWLAPACMLISSEREFDAVHSMRSIDPTLLRHILRPRLLEEIGSHYKDDNVRRSMWPKQARHPPFIDRLKREYDHKQLEAIEMAACHLGAADGAAAAAARSLPTLPFVLIQGPPGTGKTHTVGGVLNVWHLVAYQRYYDSLVLQAMPAGAANAALLRSGAPGAPAPPLPTLNAAGTNLMEVLSAGISSGGVGGRVGAAAAAHRPRILVCAPSNAACDELMGRVMRAGFCDGSGRTYRPNIVRVGGDSAPVAPAVRERLLPRIVDRYREMAQPEWQRRCSEAATRLMQLNNEVHVLELSLARAEGAQQAMQMAARLVEAVQAAQRLQRELERLDAARDLVWGRREDAALRRSEARLEELLLEEAEMVFSTLSSSQRRGFKAVAQRVPFHTVLIDEAGQASEVAALQPLGYGARSVVLVGDPQQLPATVLSAAAKAVAMERSLFERLQAQGCPVVLLSVQYRMHPQIRSFPSRHFYGDRLEDAPSVTSAPPDPYHSHPLMRPYLLFDVARGKEQRQGGGGSLSNAAEAELAACLFMELQRVLTAAAAALPPGKPPPPPTSVAVITPYREQRSVLKAVFEAMCGRGVTHPVTGQVAIETVDSFQGKQVDVVMLSCVRAGAHGGLGFVNDVRRMNVAITRARRSLWVLGSVATLQGNVEWEALIEDAKERRLVVWEAHARDLFPDLECWRREQQAEQQAGAAGAQPSGKKAQQPPPPLDPAAQPSRGGFEAALLGGRPLPPERERPQEGRHEQQRSQRQPHHRTQQQQQKQRRGTSGEQQAAHAATASDERQQPCADSQYPAPPTRR